MKIKLYLIALLFAYSIGSLGQIIDQQQNDYGSTNIFGTNDISQTFTAGQNGKFTQLSVAHVSPNIDFAPFTLNIRSGSVTGPIIATTFIGLRTLISNQPRITTIPFSSPATINAGQTYAFEFIRFYSPEYSNITTTFLGSSDGNSYPAGIGYGSSLALNFDFYFNTFVEPDATHLNFDGVNDNVELPSELTDVLANNTEFTIEYMFKGTALRSGLRFQAGNDLFITAGTQQGTNIVFNISTDGGTSSGVIIGPRSIIEDDNWHHLAFVWKKNVIFATYIDGVIQNSRVAANVNLPNFIGQGTKGNIGSDRGQSSFSVGNFDELRIWSIALSQSEIARRRSCQISTGESGLLAYYTFNQGIANAANPTITGLTCINNNTYHGILNNFSLSGNTSNWKFGSSIFNNSTIPLNPLSSSQAFCGSKTIANLTPAPSAFIKWYNVANGGVALSDTSPVTTSGVYYVAAVNSFGCESSRTSVAVTITPNTAPTATPQTFCTSTTIANLIPAPSSTIKWYSNVTGGTPLPSNTSITNSGNYYVTTTHANGCESLRTEVFITINQIPNPPSASSLQFFCVGTTIANLIPAPSTTIKWYTVPSGGVALLSTTIINSPGVYYVAAVNSCFESSRIMVNVTYGTSAPPIANITQVYSGNGTIANLTATGINLKWYENANGGLPLATITPLNNSATYYVSQTAACEESARTTVTVNKISEEMQTLCNPASVANLVSSPKPGSIANWFTQVSGGLPLANTDSLLTNIYYIEQTTPTSVEQIGGGFDTPMGVAVQSDGKIIVAETFANLIKRMDADGTNIVTLASGFNGPRAIAIQSDGKIIIADKFNNAIKRMDADGSNITILGSGFNRPEGVAIQADGKIVIADTNNHSIKRMNADGTNIVTLLSGLNRPSRVAVQPDGKIVLTDTNNNAIKRINDDGSNVVTLGSGFTSPQGIAILPDGKILVTDTNTSTLKRMNADGSSIVTLASSLVFPRSPIIQSDGIFLVASNDGIKRITEFNISNRVAVNVIVSSAPTTLYYQDLDNDGFGNPIISELTCFQPQGYVIDNSDCNDTQVQYADADGDGFGSTAQVACGVANNIDCDDNQVQYADVDGDGFGSIIQVACGVANNLDCDDSNAMFTINCIAGNALHFDGINDHVFVNNTNILNSLPLTLEAYVKPEFRTEGGGYPNNIISNDVPGSFGFGMGINIDASGSHVVVEYKNGFIFFDDPSIVEGNWVHIAVVYTTTNIKTYINGVLKNNFNYTFQGFNLDTNLIIGNHNNDTNYGTKRFFKGSIDEVRVWNRELCQQEIQNNHNCEIATIGNGLVVNYHFNQGFTNENNAAITTLIDSSSFNNNGVLWDFALNGIDSNWTDLGAVTSGVSCSPFQPQLTVYYQDADNDGFGNPLISQLTCSQPFQYVSNNLDCDDNVYSATNTCSSIVNLKLFIEGYYVGSSTMNPVKNNQDGVSLLTDVENITVELRHATMHTLVTSVVATLKTDGTAVCTFPTAPNGSFYVAVKGINMLQTWSTNPITVGATPITYDFTDAPNKAYGDNMIETIDTGVWSFYSGDINQDEVIDGSDFTDLDTDILNSEFGVRPTDINGDGTVDNSDRTSPDNNAYNSVFSFHPIINN